MNELPQGALLAVRFRVRNVVCVPGPVLAIMTMTAYFAVLACNVIRKRKAPMIAFPNDTTFAREIRTWFLSLAFPPDSLSVRAIVT